MFLFSFYYHVYFKFGKFSIVFVLNLSDIVAVYIIKAAKCLTCVTNVLIKCRECIASSAATFLICFIDWTGVYTCISQHASATCCTHLRLQYI